MAWGDINDPATYTPRPAPTVRRAEENAPDAPEYLFDDAEPWDTPLAAMQAARRARGESANPNAKRREGAKRRRSGGRRRAGHPMLYAGISIFALVALIVIGVMMMPQVFGYFWKDFDNFAFINGELLRYDKSAVASYKQYREYLQSDAIYPGVFIDGTHVGGMTRAQAESALQSGGSDAVRPFSLTVNIGNKSWTLDNANIPATRDLGNVLDRAYAVGRANTPEIIGTVKTPFRERVDAVLALRENGVNLQTGASYDHDAVRKVVDEIAAYVTRDPVNAQITGFDFNSRAFSFSEEQVGVSIDADKLYGDILAKLDTWPVGATLTAEPILTPATTTKAMLESQFKLIAAYTTKTTSDKNRNTNIRLACEAINGKALLPGETFSFNETTGQRTTAKGYQSAGAIAAGQSIEEVGGGICQVSSTLFNAVARADLEIVSRRPHAWPRPYVNKGEAATVNCPNLDCKFKNDRDTPVFVIAYYKDRTCSAEIWGMSLGDGVTIDLESHVTRTIEPSTEVNWVLNPALPVGSSKETVKARTGYVVETYQVWFKDGAEQKRELLHTSTYKAYQRTVEYN